MKFKNNTPRVIVAVLAIPIILLACRFGGLYFLGFAAIITYISFHEFSKMISKRYGLSNNFLGYLFITYLLINSYRPFYSDFFTVSIIYIVLLTIFELFRNNGSPIENIGGTLLTSLYIGLLGSSLVAIREYDLVKYENGGLLIIAIFASIWTCDSAAYYGGSAFGRHKLFPRVSPNKSWEGSLFGFAGAILAVSIFKLLGLLNMEWDAVLIIGGITGIIGQIGDLIESLFKRDAKVKDSSNILPGHGGIFDRFDSLFFSAPFVYLYLKFFVKMF